MPFKPQGLFKATKEKEYDSYCDGIKDVLDILEDDGLLTCNLRNKIFNLVVEAADDFTD